MTGYNKGDLYVQRVSLETLERYNKVREKVGLPPRFAEDFQANGWWSWIIVDFRYQKDIGYVNVTPHDYDERELSFALLPEARGKGVFSAVLPIFVRALNMKLFAEAPEGDAAHVRILEKSGFAPAPAKYDHMIGPTGGLMRSLAFRFQPPVDSKKSTAG